AAFSSSLYRRAVGPPATCLFAMTPSSLPSSGVSIKPSAVQPHPLDSLGKLLALLVAELLKVSVDAAAPILVVVPARGDRAHAVSLYTRTDMAQRRPGRSTGWPACCGAGGRRATTAGTAPTCPVSPGRCGGGESTRTSSSCQT